MNNKSDKNPQLDYQIGYGKPPIHSRYSPGQSGNPKGRPKGSKCVENIIKDAINELIDVNKGGKRIKKRKIEIAIEQLVNKSASGDLKAIIQLLQKIDRIEAAEAVKQAKSTLLQHSEADLNLMKSIAARIKKTDIDTEPDDTR